MQLGGSVVVTSRLAVSGQGTGPAVGSFDAANQANTSIHTQPTDTHTPRDELEAAPRVRQLSLACRSNGRRSVCLAPPRRRWPVNKSACWWPVGSRHTDLRCGRFTAEESRIEQCYIHC
ncbi:unnamed protein product [Pleuronectes platessa]|uniref:Uncharacterized protein n=1 Tax=Pleuronectes platessa TaxID=8262 RepID=A0A9N7Y0Y8_PLEPL|nr:unnamed protein product [Pleuronectes platessa]